VVARSLVCLALLLLFGCSSDYLAPLSERSSAPDWRPGTYHIKPGDTLYSIAWEFGLDYRDLAHWNRIRAPHKIIAGRQLRLTAPAGSGKAPKTKTAKAGNAQLKTSSRPASRKTISVTSRKKTSSSASSIGTTAALQQGPIKWRWPSQGKIIATYSPHLGHNRGLNIAGKLKQPIKAAAAGRVVYAGDGLKAYGNMVIIKHSERYLSAYANNHTMLIREGQRVSAGESIATMGQRIDGKTLLHFEIRRDGKPIDPLKRLPKNR
jgi:lipoprotein NlpD